MVSTHSRTKAAALLFNFLILFQSVSTHSRTKAAAFIVIDGAPRIESFNTQPHEGGCRKSRILRKSFKCFNTQPHEGGCSD